MGGLGVGAAVHYYQRLAKAHEARGRTLDLVMLHAETSRVFSYVEADDPRGLAQYLTGYIARMKTAGAEFATIPAVTPHFCLRELIAASPLPILSIFDPLKQDLAERNARRIAIFGTRFVVESALYGQVEGVEVIAPAPEEVDFIHQTYVELLQSGEGTDQQRRGMALLAHTLISREKLDAIVFAGTDLSVLFNETNADFPHIDCAELHLRAILKEMLGEATASTL